MGRADGPFGEFLDEFLTGPLNNNNAVNVQSPNTQFENNSQKNTDLRNVRVGNGSILFSKGRFTLSTSADGSESQALETANVAEYDPGLRGEAGLFIRKDEDPAGFAQWGYGGDAFSDELFWDLHSDGSYRFERKKDGVDTTIDRDLWDPDVLEETVQDSNDNDVGVVTGLDPLDGTGPSGFDISTPITSVFGVDMVLHGGGGFAPWVVGTDRNGRVRKLHPFVFSPQNEEVLSQFNQPIFGRINNNGTSEADDLVLTERQFTVMGDSTPPARDTPHAAVLSPDISSPEAVFVFRRDGAGGPTRADIKSLNLRLDNRARVWFIARANVTNSPTFNRPRKDTSGNRVSASETSLEVAEDATVNAADGVALNGGIVAGGSGANVSVTATSLAASPFIRDEPVAVMVNPLTDSNVTAIEASTDLREGL